MAANIYDQHRAAFSNVSAYVIARNGERIGTCAIKYPRDGAGRLYAYLHFHGMPMVRGYAGGGGYDKRSAAVYDAAKRIEPSYFQQPDNAWKDAESQCAAFRSAIVDSRDGIDWTDALRNAGYDVLQAV